MSYDFQNKSLLINTRDKVNLLFIDQNLDKKFFTSFNAAEFLVRKNRKQTKKNL